MFTEVEARLAGYLRTAFGLSARASAEAAQRLLGQVLFPRFPRALFGLDDLVEGFDDKALSPKIDVRAIRGAVADLLASLPAK